MPIGKRWKAIGCVISRCGILKDNMAIYCNLTVSMCGNGWCVCVCVFSCFVFY